MDLASGQSRSYFLSALYVGLNDIFTFCYYYIISTTNEILQLSSEKFHFFERVIP